MLSASAAPNPGLAHYDGVPPSAIPITALREAYWKAAAAAPPPPSTADTHSPAVSDGPLVDRPLVSEAPTHGRDSPHLAWEPML